MNRGSALQRFGGREHTAAALAAYDEAIARQRSLAFKDNPALRVSFAASLMNRSLLLHRLHGVERATEALAASQDAESLLRPLLAADPPAVVRRNLAGTLVNRANLLLDLGDFSRGADAARAALAVVADVERRNVDCAHIALMARRAFCDALGRQLVAPEVDQEAIARAASDAVDEALALARHWSALGAGEFGPLVPRLYRFGARLYGRHQPHFLGEFLLEQLEVSPTRELLTIASDALAAALTNLEQPHLLLAGTPATDRLLATLRVLRAAQVRVADLSSVLNSALPT
jgi:tetratricopeptide (TPR) repeat protein